MRDAGRLSRRLDGGDETQRMIAAAAAATIGLRRLRAELALGRIDPATARERLGDLLAPEWFPGMPDVLRRRRAEVVWTFRAMRDNKLVSSPSPAVMQDPAAASVFVAACETFGPAIHWGPKTDAEWIRSFRTLMDDKGTQRNIYVAIEVPTLADRWCRADAAQRLARVALALTEHRAKHGDFPASLDELKPAFPAGGVPPDPYTDAPFVYEKTATGVRIASEWRLADDPDLDADERRDRALVWELKR
jgi:hypothetical protein